MCKGGPATDWRPVQGVAHLCPAVHELAPSLPWVKRQYRIYIKNLNVLLSIQTLKSHLNVKSILLTFFLPGKNTEFIEWVNLLPTFR